MCLWVDFLALSALSTASASKATPSMRRGNNLSNWALSSVARACVMATFFMVVSVRATLSWFFLAFWFVDSFFFFTNAELIISLDMTISLYTELGISKTSQLCALDSYVIWKQSILFNISYSPMIEPLPKIEVASWGNLFWSVSCAFSTPSALEASNLSLSATAFTNPVCTKKTCSILVPFLTIVAVFCQILFFIA